MIKTDTGHANNKCSIMALKRQRRVRVFCANRNIYKQDFAKLANVSLSTLYRYLRGEYSRAIPKIEAVIRRQDVIR